MNFLLNNDVPSLKLTDYSTTCSVFSEAALLGATIGQQSKNDQRFFWAKSMDTAIMQKELHESMAKDIRQGALAKFLGDVISGGLGMVASGWGLGQLKRQGDSIDKNLGEVDRSLGLDKSGSANVARTSTNQASNFQPNQSTIQKEHTNYARPTTSNGHVKKKAESSNASTDPSKSKTDKTKDDDLLSQRMRLLNQKFEVKLQKTLIYQEMFKQASKYPSIAGEYISKENEAEREDKQGVMKVLDAARDTQNSQASSAGDSYSKALDMASSAATSMPKIFGG